MATEFENIAQRAKGELEVPWDDLRSARTQKAVLAALREAKEKRASEVSDVDRENEQPGAGETRPRRWLYGSLMAAVVIAAALLLWLRAPVEMTPAPWAAAELAYQDGSRSLLEENAQVQVIEDGADAVKVQQRAGRVRYQIKPRAARRFQVRAHGVTITVLGTVFDVKVEPALVTVSVERGRVQVDHDGKRLVLTSGKRLAMAVAAEEPRTKKAAPAVGEPVTAEGEKSELRDEGTAPRAAAKVAPGEAVKAMSATGVGGRASAKGPTADELMHAADQARGRADYTAAATALRQLISKHPRDRRVTLARFNLARVFRAQGNHAAAAQAFEQCGRALRGDAIAEAAFSWQQAGDGARAQAAAKRYLDAFADGVHAPSMRKLSLGK